MLLFMKIRTSTTKKTISLVPILNSISKGNLSKFTLESSPSRAAEHHSNHNDKEKSNQILTLRDVIVDSGHITAEHQNTISKKIGVDFGRHGSLSLDTLDNISAFRQRLQQDVAALEREIASLSYLM